MIALENKKFGEVVRELRMKSGYGSRELSKRINKGVCYISQVENGRNKTQDASVAWLILHHLGLENEDIDIIFEHFGYEKIENVEKLEQSIKKNKKCQRHELIIGSTKIQLTLDISINKEGEFESLVQHEKDRINFMHSIESPVVTKVINDFYKQHEDEIKKTILNQINGELRKIQSHYKDIEVILS